ncbi:ADP-ribosylation factor-like protein 16 [Ixodes scapularis]|uniref:ADP-ribosylation factor-like protein 16 n=1 Tax=Ixodes scapularis TaxID=6945 RepID=UPI001A9D61E5|nr:ADP-ribosylation factor-like protein 16 [Ixodes scapularis]
MPQKQSPINPRIGPSGSGKTTLLKRLEQHMDGRGRTSEMEIPRPTVGVNMTKLKIKKKAFSVREIGGQMAPLWPQQCAGALGLVYVVDSSNLQQFSASVVLLLDLLNLESLRDVPFLVVFNKVDAYLAVPLDEYKTAFRLNDILEVASQPLRVVQTSCLTEYGLDEVVVWLSEITSK